MNSNIEEEVNKNLQDINDLGFKKCLTLNTKQVSNVVGVSPSTIENWRKEGIGPSPTIVGGRCLYSKRKIAEWLATSNIKTA